MKIAVLISGGVDSAVALKLLKEQGHDLKAFYLKIWLEDDLKFLGANCPWEEDLSYVRKICEEADVPLQVVPLQKEYFDTVVAYTIEEVKKGHTPNPDIMCNNQVKFNLFFEKVQEKFDKVATGHYAKSAYKKGDEIIDINLDFCLDKNAGKNLPKGGKYILKTTPDPIKDQTYFLSNLKQEQLKKLIFPIGDLTKEEVRKLAQKYNLPNKERKDSQGICFLGKLKYNDFIKHYLGEKKGDLIEYESGKKLGAHEGFWYFTIGQRKGISLPDGPWFVVDKDKKKNVVYISKKYYEEDKKRNEFEVGDLNWFDEDSIKKVSPVTLSKNLKVKLRHGPKFYDCKIKSLPKGRLKVKISENDQGIAPGQFAVFYNKDICLGSGVIFEKN
jgi:tRNA-5-taurinomethyluridine 2-sulfurtransferase